MSKIILWVVIAAVVVFGGYSLIRSKNEPATVATDQIKNEPSPQSSGKKIAFSEFVKQGGSYKCDVKQAFSDMENSGTLYISSGNISGDYNTVAEGKNIQTWFVLKDGYSYTWSSVMPSMGWKVKVDTSASVNTNASSSGTYSWNANQIGDYNCEPWTFDSAKFVLPASITFKDASTLK